MCKNTPKKVCSNISSNYILPTQASIDVNLIPENGHQLNMHLFNTWTM